VSRRLLGAILDQCLTRAFPRGPRTTT
jgi:hypothetical protein